MCALFDGAWCVSKIYKVSGFVRYEVRQHERFENDIPEIWLSRAKLKERKFHVCAI